MTPPPYYSLLPPHSSTPHPPTPPNPPPLGIQRLIEAWPLSPLCPLPAWARVARRGWRFVYGSAATLKNKTQI